MEKQDLRSLSSEEKLALRRVAIRMLKKGKSKSDIIADLGINKNTMTAWAQAYNSKGSASFKYKKRGVKSADKKLLSVDQEKAIQQMIVDKMPEQLKFSYALWTRKAVKELVERQFGIVLGLTTMGDYLRLWGFTPQKPKKCAYERNDEATKQWLEEEYPKIKQQAKAEGAEIHWADETGVKNQCHHGRSYAPKGKTPVKKSMSKKFKTNMISSVTNQGKVQFLIYSDNMNAEKFIEFLNQLMKSTPKKIYAIVDNLRTHHSKLVKAWAQEHKDGISLFYLPSYSPDLNPDEYLNCDLKQGLSAIKSPKTEKELINNVENHMEMLTKNTERVKKYFKHSSIKYAACDNPNLLPSG